MEVPMRAVVVKKSLRRWHLGTVAVAMTTASAAITLAIIGPEGTLPISALVGWALPFVLHGLLRRSSEAVGAPSTPFGYAIGAMFLGIVLVPMMLQRTAAGVGAVVGDPRLATRQIPLVAGWVLAQFLPIVVGLVAGFGVAWAVSGVLQVLLLAVMTWQIQAAAVEHVELQERDAFRVGDAAGHRVPVAVRS
jgi:hypothetical protein